MGKIFVLVPIYNESDAGIVNVREVIAQIGAYNYEIIVVDDGSCDGTESLLNQLSFTDFVTVIRHQQNLGLGEVFQSFFKYIYGTLRNEDIVIVIEGDRTCDVGLLNKMIEIIQSGVDVVIASRKCLGGQDIGGSIFRRSLTSLSNIILKAALQLWNIHDVTIFYRAYSGSILNKAYKIFGESLFWGKGFVMNTNLLYRLKCINAHICEIPHLYRRSRKVSKSKLRLWSTIGEYITYIIKINLEKS